MTLYRHMQRSGVSRLKLLGRHRSKAETAAQGRSQRRGQRRRARLCANTAIASPKARGRPASRRTSSTVDVLALRRPSNGTVVDGGTMAKKDAAAAAQPASAAAHPASAAPQPAQPPTAQPLSPPEAAQPASAPAQPPLSEPPPAAAPPAHPLSPPDGGDGGTMAKKDAASKRLIRPKTTGDYLARLPQFEPRPIPFADLKEYDVQLQREQGIVTRADEVFLALLDRFTSANRNVGDKKGK